MGLDGKKILIGITGGIAAYKINYLVRALVKANAEVKVIMTPYAEKFTSKLVLSTLSKNPVYSDFYNSNSEWNSHVELGLWADAMVVAPCTANTLAKMRTGLCDNILLATYLSAKCPVFIAPAMDLDMYKHPSTLSNIEALESFGNTIIPVENGELASGLSGEGRLAEPETIFQILDAHFNQQKSLDQKTILITAGPTYEAIDPVRFIGNHSSGKMGYSIAKTCAERGAKVILVSGPTNEKASHKNIEIHKVTSAKEMYKAVFKFYENVDIAIASAAVADYAPKITSKEKIKKSDDTLSIELVKNPDILKTMGEKKNHQYLVGFALETENEELNAKTKLDKKNLDMIVLNSLKDKGAGFQSDTNKIKIITKGDIIEFPVKPKNEVADDILNFIEKNIKH
ncbi:bifunctional phosphopantothenoylcysteine decarboxylase/phosphopantothenate--cysteine ligase CoaBC [Riemerella columbipharyngis]|uniref:Coenzyme A biosynthesis bifunctional protein CoaBC n=1 Tax=Riemerella columbipharyngis TaxID=1071918 RepID=A0A1G7D3Z1_9FLAO|nr:bifunctional phosphopantothenoylcysteine decarboxylase/phosphopantothenate--cysteine ligase CoaBC [Riemerella columbipharyngis]SDE46322.1 phosphopantothenoylcysteine decarboxylase / phosphopantothenate--cysteine ligase [Riemerella columbipharyngis]